MFRKPYRRGKNVPSSCATLSEDAVLMYHNNQMEIKKMLGWEMQPHCKSDGGKIQMFFYRVSMLYCLNILLYLLFDNTICKTGGFSPFWLGFQGVSSIGWYSKYTWWWWKESLPLGAWAWFFFVDYSVRKKYNLLNFNKEICYNGHDFRIYKINFQNHIQPLQFPAVRMSISILTRSNTPVEMRSGKVQLDKTYCLYLIQCTYERNHI